LPVRDPTVAAAPDDLTATSYQQFAITDDAIINFFNQDGLQPHEEGPLEVRVPRSELASMPAERSRYNRAASQPVGGALHSA
jgi:hypothetical protein